jgi:hypothetical protein
MPTASVPIGSEVRLALRILGENRASRLQRQLITGCTVFYHTATLPEYPLQHGD